MKKQPKSIPVNTEYGKPQFSLGNIDFITMPFEEAIAIIKDRKKRYYDKRPKPMPVPDM